MSNPSSTPHTDPWEPELSAQEEFQLRPLPEEQEPETGRDQPAIALVKNENRVESGRPLSTMLNQAVDDVRTLTGADGALIALVGGWGLICRASSGTAPVVGSRLSTHSGLTRECVQTGQLVLCDDAQHDPRVRASRARRLGLGSVALAPIVVHGKVIGLVELFSGQATGFETKQMVQLTRAALALSSVVADSQTPDIRKRAERFRGSVVATSAAFAVVVVLALVLWHNNRGAAIAPSSSAATNTLAPARNSDANIKPSLVVEGSADSSRTPENSTADVRSRVPPTTVDAPQVATAATPTGASVSATSATKNVQPLTTPAIPEDKPLAGAIAISGAGSGRELANLTIPSTATTPTLAAAPPVAPAKAIHSERHDFVLDRTLRGHSSWVTTVAFSSDGQRLASSSWDRSVKFWDVETGQHLNTIGKLKEVQALAFSRDGRWLAAENSSDATTLWDGTTGQQVRTLPSDRPAAALGTNWVYSIAFSPDGRWLASAVDDRTVRLWDVTSGMAVRDLTGPRRSIIYAAFSPDGHWLASGGDDQTIRVWDTHTGREVKILRGHKKAIYAVAFSPNGRWLASASADKTIKVWEVESGHEVRTLTGHKNAVTSLSFSPDGRSLASGSWDKTIKIWDVDSGREIQTLVGHDHSVYTVAFDSHGDRLASGSEDGTIKLWRVNASASHSVSP